MNVNTELSTYIGRARDWLIGRLVREDYLTSQRSRILMLANIATIILTLAVLVFSQMFRAVPFSQDIITTITIVLVASILSIIILITNCYKYAAHATVFLIFTALFYLNAVNAGRVNVKSEMSYVIALLALPALIFGRMYIFVYGAAALILTWFMTYRLWQTGEVDFDRALGFGVDNSASIVFIVFITTFITSIYDYALRREKGFLEQQERSNVALAEASLLLDQAESHKRQFYRDTITSVTGGKLNICELADADRYLVDAEVSTEVHDESEVSAARHMTKDYCQSQGLTGEQLDLFVLGVGEAISNAVKHAGGSTVYAGRIGSRIWVGIADKGPGIESLNIPKVVFLRGYSTRPSLGFGYSIMLQIADQVLLKTDENGTIVILMKELGRIEPVFSLESLSDTWGSGP